MDGQGQFFLRMQGIYLGLIGVLVVAFMVGVLLLRPSHVFGFRAIADFDLSFVMMTAGMVLLLPSNLATALYRARGLYGRAVWIQCAAMLASQLAQIVAITATGGLVTIVVAFVAPQAFAAFYLATLDVRRLFPFVTRARLPARQSWYWIAGQFRRAFPFAIAASTEIALQNLPVLFVSAIVVDRIAVAQWGLTRVVAGLVRGLCTQAALPRFDRVVSPRVVRLIEDEHGGFAVEALRADNLPARFAFANGAFSAPNLVAVLKGSRVEIVLQPARFLFRPLELPARISSRASCVPRSTA